MDLQHLVSDLEQVRLQYFLLDLVAISLCLECLNLFVHSCDIYSFVPLFIVQQLGSLPVELHPQVF